MKTPIALLHALIVSGLCTGTPSSTSAAPVCEAGQNLALYSEASASSCYGSGYEAQNAIDGSHQTRWATAELIGPVWLTIDLKGVKTFNCLDVYETPQYGGRIEEVVVSVSDNGIDWRRWHSRRALGNRVTLAGTEVSARYVQVTFLDCSLEGINIDEIVITLNPNATSTPEPVAWRQADPTWIGQQPAQQANTYQRRKAHLKYGMFIHYGLNTFLNMEWSDGSDPASTYHPNTATLDPESWVKAAYEGGMNFVVLVTKHHDGFALWNTAVGTYNINHTGRKADKLDIVAEVAKACRKYGLKFGVYYSAWDRNWDRNHLPAAGGPDRVQLAQQYNDFALAQVTELMDGRYGEISEFWIDGAWVKPNRQWEFERLYNTVKRLQPSCQMAINTAIRARRLPNEYLGGEEIYFYPSDFRLHDPMFTRRGADADPKIYRHAGQDYYLPFEATVCMNTTWFWSDRNSPATVMQPEKIKEAYEHMVEQDNTLVINLSPDNNGRLTDYDVQALYAGARALGIARGAARQASTAEKEVQVRYTTTDGNVAFPTRCIYGQAGDSFTVQAEDLTPDGYRFAGKKGTVTGTYGKTRRIDFIYTDEMLHPAK